MSVGKPLPALKHTYNKELYAGGLKRLHRLFENGKIDHDFYLIPEELEGKCNVIIGIDLMVTLGVNFDFDTHNYSQIFFIIV